MRIIDNVIALRILWLLVTPFEKTDAFKLGLINADGSTIKKATTSAETNATSMLHRLVWRIKKFINLVPGGSTRIGSIVAAYALVRESYVTENDKPSFKEITEHSIKPDEDFDALMDVVNQIDTEEELNSFLEDAPVNATGAGIQNSEKPLKKTFKRFKKQYVAPSVCS